MHVHAHPKPTEPTRNARPRIRAAIIGIVVGTALMVAKFIGWELTGSQVVFSDAMESIVNVVASAGALVAVYFSSLPADEDHPYGHGKVEFLTGGFEGGMIAFAGCAIAYEAVHSLFDGTEPGRLGVGMAIVGGAGVVNLMLGAYLLRVGRQEKSPALEADGLHVLSDVWTSAGAVVGLFLVQLTGLTWLDPAIAIVFAGVLLVTGFRILRGAMRGLMDEHDPEVIGEIAERLEAARPAGVIEVHDLRAINVGGAPHVDCHVVVPEFWTVHQAHDVIDDYERSVVADGSLRADIQFHVDPCERAYCRMCELADCEVRQEPFAGRPRMTPDRVVRGPSPDTEALFPVDDDGDDA